MIPPRIAGSSRATGTKPPSDCWASADRRKRAPDGPDRGKGAVRRCVARRRVPRKVELARALALYSARAGELSGAVVLRRRPERFDDVSEHGCELLRIDAIGRHDGPNDRIGQHVRQCQFLTSVFHLLLLVQCAMCRMQATPL